MCDIEKPAVSNEPLKSGAVETSWGTCIFNLLVCLLIKAYNSRVKGEGVAETGAAFVVVAVKC